MSKATPRPWKLDVEEFKNIRIASGGYIKVNLPLYVNKQVDEETKANAELIVRAVNCHDELVKYLEEFICDTQSKIKVVYEDSYVKGLKDLLQRAKGEV